MEYNCSAGNKILVIDHQSNWLEFARDALAAAGCVIATLESARAAYRMLTRQAYDLVVIDSKAAEQESRTLRRISDLQRARGQSAIIMFSLSASPGTIREMFNAGAHDCIDKEYNSEELRKALLPRLSGSKAARLEVGCA